MLSIEGGGGKSCVAYLCVLLPGLALPAHIPSAPLVRALRPRTRAAPAHRHRARPKRPPTSRPATAPLAAPVLPQCPHRPPRGALSACRGSARCDLPRTQSPGRPSGRPSPRRSASPSPTECRLAMMSARHVRPTLAFDPRMQGRIKSVPPPKSAATTKSEIYNRAEVHKNIIEVHPSRH